MAQQITNEITCPYCSGYRGRWEFGFFREWYRGRVHRVERGTWEKCRACHGLGKILDGRNRAASGSEVLG